MNNSKSHPQIFHFRLHRIPSDFSTPKVRDSFVSKFVYETEDANDDDEDPGFQDNSPYGRQMRSMKAMCNSKLDGGVVRQASMCNNPFDGESTHSLRCKMNNMKTLQGALN